MSISASNVTSNNGLSIDDNIKAIYQLLDQCKQLQPIFVTGQKSGGQTIGTSGTYTALDFDDPNANFANIGLSLDNDGVIHVDRLINNKLRIEFSGQIAFESGTQGNIYFIGLEFAYGDENVWYKQDGTIAHQTNIYNSYNEQMISYAVNLVIPAGVTRVRLVHTTNGTTAATMYRSSVKAEVVQSHLQ